MSFYETAECESLKKQLGLKTNEEIEGFFVSINDDGVNWVLKKTWMDAKTYAAMQEWIKEVNGRYIAGSKNAHSTFIVPKPMDARSKESAKVEPNSNLVQTESEDDYSLARSMKSKLQQLVPCLKDSEGIVFDGFHRLKVNPSAWTVKLDHIKTPVDRALARMTVNFCRRHYTSEEMTNDIGLLIGAGYTVQQIAEVTGISERTIYRYMPERLKKPEAQAISEGMKEKAQLTAVSSSLKKPDIVTPVTDISEAKTLQISTLPAVTPSLKTQYSTDIYKNYMLSLRKCEKCWQKVERQKMIFKDNLLMCPKCAGKQEESEPKKLEEEIKKFKVAEKWEQHVAVMHPQKSKFELAVIQELQAEGYPFETDQEFCVQKTIPDAIIRLRDRTVALYIDNVATHKEGDERDEFLRSILEKLYGFEICVIQYKNDSQEERQKAKQQIKEFLKW